MTGFNNKVKKMQQDVIVDIQKYSFTVFKNTFKKQTKFNTDNLNKSSLIAYNERLKLNKKTKGKMTRKLLSPSDVNSPPRQDNRKYLSNNVRYINQKNSTTIFLNLPFGKTLDEGGNIQLKQYKTPYGWMGLDKLFYAGIQYFGKIFKTKNNRNAVGMFISDNARIQQTNKKKVTWFNKNKASVELASKQKIVKNKYINARPFTGFILNNILKSGKIESALKKRMIK